MIIKDLRNMFEIKSFADYLDHEISQQIITTIYDTNTLYIMQACSGSGKSTFIKKIIPEQNICSADYYFMKDGVYSYDITQMHIAHQICKTKCEQLCAGNIPRVGIDNTNTTEREIEPYLEIAHKYNYNVTIFSIRTDVELCKKRNIHNVPEEVVQKQYDRVMNYNFESHIKYFIKKYDIKNSDKYAYYII